MDIKPIETFYNGYRFRSRLEARWAVFFDAAGIKYEYEPEGFDLGNGIYYLPDFYLPDLDVWCEVKGTKISEEDKQKIDLFRGDPEYSCRTLLMLREIPIAEDECTVVGDTYGYKFGNGDIGWDCYYQFCVCPACGKIGLEFDGRGWRVCGNKHKNKNSIIQTYEDEDGTVHRFKYHIDGRTDDKGYTAGVPIFANAYLKARQARFEHGETPIPKKKEKLDPDLISHVYKLAALLKNDKKPTIEECRQTLPPDLRALAERLKNAGTHYGGDGG